MSTSTQSLNAIGNFLFNLKSMGFVLRNLILLELLSMANGEMNKEIIFIWMEVQKIPYKSTLQLCPPRRKILGQFLGSQNLFVSRKNGSDCSCSPGHCTVQSAETRDTIQVPCDTGVTHWDLLQGSLVLKMLECCCVCRRWLLQQGARWSDCSSLTSRRRRWDPTALEGPSSSWSLNWHNRIIPSCW